MSFPPASPELSHHPTISDNSPTHATLPATDSRPAGPDNGSSRSCVTCRRRKVRCNKRSPCSNCVKAGIECIFPPPGRAPRRLKRPPDAELLSRLRRLEGVIEHLGGKNAEPSSSLSPPTQTTPPSAHPSTAGSEATAATTSPEGPAPDGPCPFASDPKKPPSGRFENEFGRLVIDEGRSRYVSNRLWASMGDEIEELQDILDHSSSDEEDNPSPGSSHSTSHDGFLFGFYSLSHSLRDYHPPLPKVSMLWETYRENVAPLITIIHRPTARKLLVEAAQHPETLDKNSEALVFAMYLSAIVSMNPDECLSRFGEDRNLAVKRYRFAVEQALAKAGFLNTQSLVLLQAAILFLICVRREDDSKFVWSMNSVVLRLAQGLGLHRDGTNFALKPFETEMRRRLWWHICLMDIRSSEDHGTDPLIHENMYDTRLPLNVNDDDISPGMQETPEEREGCTDVTFCLIRCEITSALRRANYACPGNRFRMEGSGPSLDRCERMIQIISERCEERYIKHCNMDIPIHWCSATVGRLILAKLWLIVHHPMTRRDRVTNLPQATRESLFLTAIEVLEFGRLLEKDPKTAKWGWLFRTNMQWHGVAFVLSELCVRPICPITDRAWNAVSSLYTDWRQQAGHKKGMLWRPLAALMKRAEATRAKQHEELRSKFGPVPTPSQPASAQVATGHHHSLPQIHLPTAAPTPPSMLPAAINTALPSSGLPLNFNLGNEPWEALQDVFPSTNLLSSRNLFDTSPSQDPVSAASIPADFSFNVAPSNPFISQDPLPEPPPLSWDEWDQVMRDFQMDVEKDENHPSKGTNVSDWLT
ncbi:hypothetical protein NUU61_009243 [Penicillium alfredii]|uniref:Zn(2)-C6 fungal-type domain-containing protein n=1 Tax=Penicillium alfredii TaxID=1506179 RepID=A0A9W9EMX8_9EURO|nr:uncharacterized protein NUU61_009243 [Penicillium alfredii]KAJ5084664.1 hypothetical protein NUU61_009243 [Penicillium alfredii]